MNDYKYTNIFSPNGVSESCLEEAGSAGREIFIYMPSVVTGDQEASKYRSHALGKMVPW